MKVAKQKEYLRRVRRLAAKQRTVATKLTAVQQARFLQRCEWHDTRRTARAAQEQRKSSKRKSSKRKRASARVHI